MLSLVSPHMQITVLPHTTKHRNTLSLFRCFSSLLAFGASVFLMGFIIFYARILSFNSKDKLDVSCMDYTAIRKMIITPFLNENHTISWYDISRIKFL